MSKRTLLSVALLLVLIAAGSLVAYQGKRPDMPPGVTVERWIPLTDTSGVVLNIYAKYGAFWRYARHPIRKSGECLAAALSGSLSRRDDPG